MKQTLPMKLRDKQILQIALPSIVSNITVPLLGLIDVAIVGHLGSPAYIGAIAVGGMLFNIIYWIFGFLRMGTSGMTSQAYGKRDLPEVVRLLVRSVGIGLAVAFCLIALQIPHQARRIPADSSHRRGQRDGNALFSYLHLGSTRHAGAIRAHGMVHRHAEFTHSHVYSHHTEYSQYHCQPQPGLSVRDESRRSRPGDADSPVRRFPRWG